MSNSSIQSYYRNVEKIIDYSGSKNETSIRTPFFNLLNDYARQKNFELVQEISIKSNIGTNIIPDGTLKDSLRLDIGYWESKDESDDIDIEISKKFAKGYPKDNILFEDSNNVILYQNGQEVARIDIKDEKALDLILKTFVNFEKPEVESFHKAIELFKSDIPRVTKALKDLLKESANTNQEFVNLRDIFLKTCKQAINPDISQDDINEMMIQHILTADIFNTIFDEVDFHRENNIAKQLEEVIKTFFTKHIKEELLSNVKQYYNAIKASASRIADHHEKQKFLKVVYENFYKSYNPKAADKLGVVYTPNEIVRFMIESTDYLLDLHFESKLANPDVEILDIATGTGTFICDLIDYLPKNKLEYKYKNEIHANEIAILPYYIANLNIEFTYKQRMKKYEEYKNLCFVDTLDNMGFDYKHKQRDLFGLTAENTERIKSQNKRKISVVIGNPPYNANQMNENDNNKNRQYPIIDKRIKDTFIKNSTAQKTKVYDMYSRFYRWAMDRIGEEGVIAFVTNRSFINSKTFDGFRKSIQNDFNACYIIDTQSDVRTNPKIAGTTHNVFGIKTGVAVMFLVKSKSKEKNRIKYFTLTDDMRKEDKLQWFSFNKINNIDFEEVKPDKNNNWIKLDINNWDKLLPLANKESKLAKRKDEENAIFKLFSNGVVTARDEWVHDFNKQNLETKVKCFYELFESEKKRWNKSDMKLKSNDFVDRKIKWTSELESYLKKGTTLKFNRNRIINSCYRPFIVLNIYYDKIITHRIYQNNSIISIIEPKPNKLISFSGTSSSKPFQVLSTNLLPSFDLLEKTQCLPYYRYSDKDGRNTNVTDWGLKQFVDNYKDKSITKEEIFHYVYSVLHNSKYRKKYELNLKREFPRIPFYKDFRKWCDWGKKLMDLHIEFENIEKFNLKEIKINSLENPKFKLKADKEIGEILLDENTKLVGVLPSAWEYKLGNRSALEWILDQYKEKKPKDPTIAEKFNNYKFSDYKEKVIDLLMRVTTVSLETVKIIKEMELELE